METTTETPRGTTDVAAKALWIFLIVGWLGLALWAAGALVMIGSLSVATFFSEPGDNWAEAIGFSVAGVIAAAAGPLGVWVFHRRRGWLVTAGWTAVITGMAATYLLVTFSEG